MTEVVTCPANQWACDSFWHSIVLLHDDLSRECDNPAIEIERVIREQILYMAVPAGNS